MFFKYALKVLLLICTLFYVSVSKAEVTENDITRIEQALNSITTFKAAFSQLTEDGIASRGTFYLSRPGKIRWEYTNPTILIVGQKSLIAYYDGELDEVSYIRLEEVLASFLTKEVIDLHKDLRIASLDKNNSMLRIRVLPNNPDSSGELTLIFEENTMQLKGLEVLDTVGKRTKITFFDIEQGLTLNSDLFLYPKEKKQRKRNY